MLPVEKLCFESRSWTAWTNSGSPVMMQCAFFRVFRCVSRYFSKSRWLEMIWFIGGNQVSGLSCTWAPSVLSVFQISNISLEDDINLQCSAIEAAWLIPVPLQIKTKFSWSRGYLTSPSGEVPSTVSRPSKSSNKSESGLPDSGL